MEPGNLIGLGVGFGLVGIIYSVLAARKPDLAFFNKDGDPMNFYRKQGVANMFGLYGVLMLIVGVMYLVLPESAENAAAQALGVGVGLVVVCGVLAVFCYRNPPAGPFKKYEGKNLWMTQGSLLMDIAFGVIFLVMGLMGKPWAN